MNLIEGIHAQQKRLREELIPEYEAIGGPGMIGVSLMKASIEAADKAIESGDVVAMLRAYKDLEGHTG